MKWRSDIEWVRSQDPAAPGPFLTALITPGLHAVWMHRIYSRLWRRGILRPFGSLLYRLSTMITRINLHPEAIISSPMAIDHGTGVIIGPNVFIGMRVLIYQGTRIGVDGEKVGDQTLVGDDCMVGAGAKIMRGVVVGPHSKVGANAVVLTPVPPNSTAVGIPAQVRYPVANRVEGLSNDLVDPALFI